MDMDKEIFSAILTVLGFVLLPGGGFFLLYYHFSHLKTQDFSPFQQLGLLLTLAILPPFMFWQSSSLFTTTYQTEYWFCSKQVQWVSWLYTSHAGSAWLAFLPLCLIVSYSLAKAIFDEEDMETSSHNAVMLVTLLICAAWYTYASLFFNRALIGQMTSRLVFAIPLGFACLNYLLFLLLIVRRKRLRPVSLKFVGVWLSSIGATLLANYYLAKQAYEQLPKYRPGNGECFIVSAAAKGHPGIVRSRPHPVTGRPVNRQLSVFRTFEFMLQRDFPHCHHCLRCCYNIVGPRIARRIRYRWQADVVYMLLKPCEVLVWGVLALTEKRRNRS